MIEGRPQLLAVAAGDVETQPKAVEVVLKLADGADELGDAVGVAGAFQSLQIGFGEVAAVHRATPAR